MTYNQTIINESQLVPAIQEIADNTFYETSKKKFVVNLYRNLKKEGFDVCILNDLYLIVNDVTIQPIHSKKEGTYKVKALEVKFHVEK